MLRSHIYGFISLLGLVTPASASTAKPPVNERGLAARIDYLARHSQGEVGLCAIHVPSAWQFCHQGDMPFSTASTYKVPIALQFLRRAAFDRLDLDTLVPLRPGDMRAFGPLATYFPSAEVAVSWRRLLHLMITVSDNTASDIILRRAGGTAAVTQMLSDLRITGMRVDRSVLELLYDIYGLGLAPPDGKVSLAQLRQLRAGVSRKDAHAADFAFGLDRRDHTTPLAMAQLLREVVVRAPHEESMQQLWDLMAQTVPARMTLLLPPGTRVARKTGSNSQHAYNDVGIIDLPNDRGQLILTLFLRSRRPVADKEILMGQLARATYDHAIRNLGHTDPPATQQRAASK